MFWDEYKEKAHVFYFEFLAESMSNMHSLIHAHLIAFFVAEVLSQESYCTEIADFLKKAQGSEQ